MGERVRLGGLLGPAFAGLAGVTRPSGARVLQGLAHDLEIVPSFEQGWERVCAAAWLLGLASLTLEPSAAFASAFRPMAASRRVAERGGYRVPYLMAELVVAGAVVATLTGQAGQSLRPFDREAFAVAVERFLARFATGN